MAAGLAPPEVWIVEDLSTNAFACERSDGRGVVVITRGLLDRLDRDEVQAVIAHEVAHLKNGDTRLMTLLFGVSRVLDLVQWIAVTGIRLFVWIGRTGRRLQREEEEQSTEGVAPSVPERDPT